MPESETDSQRQEEGEDISGGGGFFRRGRGREVKDWETTRERPM
jgi:hypothetical protein